MFTIILIVVLVVGIGIGVYFASRKSVGGLIAEQSKNKNKNKKRILEFLRQNKKATNNDIENLLGVSDATATRYLDELEKGGEVQQIGQTGRSVHYILNGSTR